VSIPQSAKEQLSASDIKEIKPMDSPKLTMADSSDSAVENSPDKKIPKISQKLFSKKRRKKVDVVSML